MKWSSKFRGTEWLVAILLVAAAFFTGDYIGRRSAPGGDVIARDTVVRTVTVYKDFPDPAKSALSGYISIPRYCFITDTEKVEIVALQRDTVTEYVYLPREQQYYEEEDGRLRLWVSGYQPRLDRYELDYPEVTITNTVTRRPRFAIGIQLGYGLTLRDGKVGFSPYAGIGATATIGFDDLRAIFRTPP